MTDNSGSDVNAASSTATDDYSFLDNSGNYNGVNEASPTSKVTAEQESFNFDAETAEQSADNPVETTANTPEVEPVADTKQDSAGVKKRIDKLTAKYKQAQEQQQAAINKEIQEKLRYQRAFELLKEQYEAKESRLSELEYVDPIKAENERLHFDNKLRAEQERLNADFNAKVQEAQQRAQVQAMAEQILDEVEEAVAKYPTVSTYEIAVAIQKDKNANVADIAKSLHEAKAKHLEQEFVNKYKQRLNAPAPVSPNGSTVRRPIRNDAELAEELDAVLGMDWHQIK